MKVGILLVTHSDIGKQLLLTATSIFGKNPFRVELLSVDNYDQPNDVKELAEKYVKFLDSGAGVLVLTDIIGTTPSNIASSINHDKIKVVAGLNLSMCPTAPTRFAFSKATAILSAAAISIANGFSTRV